MAINATLATAAALLRENRAVIDFDYLRAWVARRHLATEFAEVRRETFPDEASPLADPAYCFIDANNSDWVPGVEPGRQAPGSTTPSVISLGAALRFDPRHPKSEL